MSRFNQTVAHFLISYRGPLFVVAIVLAVMAWQQARSLDFDRRIETMFAPDDPLLPPYQKLKDTFGGNEIVVLVYHDEGLLAEDGSGIRRLAVISQRLSQVEGVRDVLSLSAINKVLDRIRAMTPFTTFTKMCVVDPGSDLGANYRELFAKYTHSTDGKTVAAVCMLRPETDSNLRAATIEALRKIANNLPQEVGEGLIVGEPAMVVDGFRYVEEDGWRLGWSTSVLLALVIVVCFRNLRWVVIPLVVVQFAVLLTKAILVVSSFQLSMVSSMLTSIVTVTGIATVIHITVHFREYRQFGLPPNEALTNTVAILAKPILWTCLTTAAGFGSLLVAEVGPVQDFGLMLAIGSLFVLLSVIVFVPALALFGSIGIDPKTAWGEKILDRQLQRIVAWVENSPWAVSVLVIVVVGLTVSGMSRLDVESDFTKNFRADTPIVTSYEYVEENLGGAGVWDILLPSPRTDDNAELTSSYLALVDRLENRLRDIPNIPVVDESRLSANWHRFDRASSGFSAAFPVEPTRKSGRSRGLVTSGYTATTPDSQVIYAVIYQEISPQDAADPAAYLDQTVARFAGQMTNRSETQIDGLAAVELDLKFQNKKTEWLAKSWLCPRGTAMYQLSVSWPSDATEKPLWDMFRQSFRFIDSALTKVVSLADADQATKVPPILHLAGPRLRLNRMQDELPVFYSSMLNSTRPEYQPVCFTGIANLMCAHALGLPVPVSLAAIKPISDQLDDRLKKIIPPYGYLRIMLCARERQSASSKLAVIDQVQAIVDDELQKPEWIEFYDSLIADELVVKKVKELFPEDDWPAVLTNLRKSDDPDAVAKAQGTVEQMLGSDNWNQFVDVVRDKTPQAEVTGFFVLLTNLIKSMIRDQWVCFGVATAAIAVMMLIAFRSPVLALIALVPNALPIVMVFGLMGWLGIYYEHIKINMGAAMIAAVSMGLSVDSSIHYIISFQRERAQKKTVHESLAIVQKSVGRAVVFSTLALIVGFTVLCTSNFVPTIYFGVLVSLSMLGGLFGNLVVLPLLLRIVTRDK